MSIKAIRGELAFRSFALRGYGIKTFNLLQTVSPGQTLSMEVEANDSTAGVPVHNLTARDRAQLIKPPTIITGKSVFQKTVCFTDRREVVIESQTPGAAIHYTLDGSEPSVDSPTYAAPVVLSTSAVVRALATKDGRQSVPSAAVEFERITGIKNVDMVSLPSPEYPGHGELTLVNKKRGSVSHTDGEWLGFEGNDLDVTIDLGEPRRIKKVTVGFLSHQQVWIFLPATVEVSLGKTREEMRRVFRKSPETLKSDDVKVESISAETKSVLARFIRVKAQNVGTCPAWHPAAGRKAWLFVDEITVD